jgi:hypothetical protein
MNFRLTGLRKFAVLWISVAGHTKFEFRTADWGVKETPSIVTWPAHNTKYSTREFGHKYELYRFKLKFRRINRCVYYIEMYHALPYIKQSEGRRSGETSPWPLHAIRAKKTGRTVFPTQHKRVNVSPNLLPAAATRSRPRNHVPVLF